MLTGTQKKVVLENARAPFRRPVTAAFRSLMVRSLRSVCYIHQHCTQLCMLHQSDAWVGCNITAIKQLKIYHGGTVEPPYACSLFH